MLVSLAEFGPGLVKTTKADVESFLDSRDLGPQSRYTYTAHLHAFYNWAVRAEVLNVDPTATIDRPRLPKRLPKPIPQGELDRALEGADPQMTAWLPPPGCPGGVQDQRRAEAMADAELQGVWGGTSGRDRRRMRSDAASPLARRVCSWCGTAFYRAASPGGAKVCCGSVECRRAVNWESVARSMAKAG